VTTNQKIRYIAHHYGYEPQSRQCIEELAELIQAINKFDRAGKKLAETGNDQALHEMLESVNHVAEEIADVAITVAQLQELMGIEDEQVFGIVDMKLDREIMRIREAI